MIDSFAQATVVERVGEDAFRWIVPDHWQQGRGAFGGLVVGATIRAFEHFEPEKQRVLRSIAADICAPVVVGEATIEVSALRRGKGTSFLDARVVQGGEIVAHATAVLATPKHNPSTPLVVSPPRLPESSALEAVRMGPPSTPVFTQHYEYRSAHAPFDATAGAACEGWIREKRALSSLDAAAIAGRIDAWWPTLFSLDPKPRPMATIAFTLQLAADPASFAAEAPFAFRSRMLSLSEGFFVELRELWSGDRLVALNPQTFAVLA